MTNNSKTLSDFRKQIAQELGILAEDVRHYFLAGIPKANHERDIENQIAASTQVILDLFGPESKSDTPQISNSDDASTPPVRFTDDSTAL